MLHPTLQRESLESLALLRAAVDANGVADALEIPVGQLLYILYKRGDADNYKHFRISKKRPGEFRDIHAPLQGLAILQSKLLTILGAMYRAPAYLHAFSSQSTRSVVSNAKQHQGKRWVANIDIVDFFGSIKFPQVFGTLKSAHYKLHRTAAALIAQMCTLQDGGLPQGAPTSPILSNIVGYHLDRRLLSLAKKNHLTYSRYADDITFSTTKREFPVEVLSYASPKECGRAIPGSALTSAIEDCGFRLNLEKCRLQSIHERQSVTGIVVNEHANLDRKYLRRIRAMIHNLRIRGLDEAARLHFKAGEIDEALSALYHRQLVGHLSWIQQVLGKENLVFGSLCQSLDVALTSAQLGVPQFVEKGVSMGGSFDVFICHAGEDRKSIAYPINDALEALDLVTFLDKKDIRFGESFVQKINWALGHSKVIIEVLSQNSVEKAWPLREINAGIQRMIAAKAKFFFVFTEDALLEKFPIVGDYNHYKWGEDIDMLAAGVAEMCQN